MNRPIIIYQVEYSDPDRENWQPEPVPSLSLTEEEYQTLLRGFAPDWECRFAPYYYEDWLYITRSGFWVKKMRFIKERDGRYHLAEHYTTHAEIGRNLLCEILIEGYFRPSLKEIGVRYLKRIKEDNKKTATDFLPELGLEGYNVKSVISVLIWRGYEVFSPEFPCLVKIGQPILILVKDGRARQASDEECAEIMSLLPDTIDC